MQFIQGERVSLRVAGRELIGFVESVEPLRILDRHGVVHDVQADAVEAGRRVGVALGRDPRRAPRALLDDLAGAAGMSGEVWVARISDVLAGRPFPASAPRPEGVHLDGEWVTLGCATPDAVVAACWWATRLNARSVQVRCADAAGLVELGFVQHPG